MAETRAFDPAHPGLGWQPAVPLPLFVGYRLRKCLCDCGARFRNRALYDAHWRAEHGQ